MNAVVSLASVASAPAVAVPSMTPHSNPEAELLALGQQFDRAADRYNRVSQQNTARHDAAVNATPKPENLLYTEADAAIGLPEPRFDWIDDPGFTSIDFPALRAFDHPRGREIIAGYEAWHERRRQAVDAHGYLDDHPEADSAYDEASRLHDLIIAIPANTIAGLQVKARASYWVRFGDVRHIEENGCHDLAACSILRDLLQPQGLAPMSDIEFFETNPFAGLATA